MLAKGDNKVSFKLRSGMQVDVRTLPPESYGAAMQYFTGSKNHNVSLRQCALKMGFTLSEYGLFRLDNNKRVAGATEDEIYGKLKLDCIPPELRENCGEIEAAEKHALPTLITVADLRGEVQCIRSKPTGVYHRRDGGGGQGARRQHEDGRVIWRIVAPPTRPSVVRPRASDRTEHIAPERSIYEFRKALLRICVTTSVLRRIEGHLDSQSRSRQLLDEACEYP